MTRNINGTGLDLISNMEGNKLEAYRCIAGVWTIGVGHTGPDVYPNKRITTDESYALLDRDLDRFEDAVSAACKIKPTENQFAALVSFAFNIGEEGFRSSTVLRMHNAGDFVRAAAAFKSWNKFTNPDTGKLEVSPGLVRRRDAEAELYAAADVHALPVIVKLADPMPQAVEPPKTVTQSKTVVTSVAGGAITIGGIAANAGPAMDAINQATVVVASARTTWDGVKDAIGPLLSSPALPAILGVLALACIGFVVWRYIIKARRGDVVVS